MNVKKMLAAVAVATTVARGAESGPGGPPGADNLLLLPDSGSEGHEGPPGQTTMPHDVASAEA